LTENASTHCSLWDLEAAHRNLFFISSAFWEVGLEFDHLCCSSDQNGWEKWIIEKNLEGNITIFSSSKNVYLGCSQFGRIIESPSCGPDFYWALSVAPTGHFYLVLYHHKMYLRCNLDEFSVTAELPPAADFEQHVCFLWKLDPCPPDSTSATKNWLLYGGAAAVAALATPFILKKAVDTAGFGSEGIYKDSFASRLMSKDAKASGGGVRKGGRVAVCQSIGTSGLGVLGTVTSMSAGATLGGMSVSAVTSQERSSSGMCKMIIEQQGPEAPRHSFCNWRHWKKTRLLEKRKNNTAISLERWIAFLSILWMSFVQHLPDISALLSSLVLLHWILTLSPRPKGCAPWMDQLLL
jgi:hypothetical protein